MTISPKQLKKGIFLSVSVSIIAIVIVMILTQDGFSYRNFSRIRPKYLLLASIVTLSFWLIKSLKLKILVSGLGGNISLYIILQIYLASTFVSHVTPSSSGGLPFQVYFLHRKGLALGKTTALTVIDNMLTFLFLLIITPLFLLYWSSFLNLGKDIILLFYLAVLLGIVFFIISLVLIFNIKLAHHFINWLTNRVLLKKIFNAGRLERFSEFLESEINYFNEGIELLFRKQKKYIIFVIVYTIFYWILYLALAPVLLQGLGINVAVPSVILAQLIFNFVQPVIPTPGGSGGAELGFAYLFKFMVPVQLLGVFIFLWRFFMFYSSLIIGGIYFLHLVKGTSYLE